MSPVSYVRGREESGRGGSHGSRPPTAWSHPAHVHHPIYLPPTHSSQTRFSTNQHNATMRQRQANFILNTTTHQCMCAWSLMCVHRTVPGFRHLSFQTGPWLLLLLVLLLVWVIYPPVDPVKLTGYGSKWRHYSVNKMSGIAISCLQTPSLNSQVVMKGN